MINTAKYIFQPSRIFIGMVFTAALLGGCEVGRVAPNAGDISLSQENDTLITDAEFAPSVLSIVPYERCELISSNDRLVVDPNDCNLENIAEKTYFNQSGLRFLLRLSKPVYFNEARQGNIGLVNAEFVETGVDGFLLQPVIVEEVVDENTNETTKTFIEVTDYDDTKKYAYFTTRERIGSVVPQRAEASTTDESEFTINIPGRMFYDINPNGKKIYSNAANATFHYDNEAPAPTISFSAHPMNRNDNDDPPSMSPSANDYDGLGYDFSSITMEIQWLEAVSPVPNITQLLESSGVGSTLMEIVCVGECDEGLPYNGGKSISNGTNGIRFAGVNSQYNPTKYSFELIEADVTGDLLKKLLTPRQLSFRIKRETFEDLAGNANVDDFVYTVNVDKNAPEIDSITPSLVGGVDPGAVANGNQTVLGIGDKINFDVIYSEEVTVPDYSRHALEIGTGNNHKLFARLISSQRNLLGNYRREWNYSYTVQENVGSNPVNANVTIDGATFKDIPGDQFSGDPRDSNGIRKSSWESDISYMMSADSKYVFDKVLLPINEFKHQGLSSHIFINNSGNRLNRIHIDAYRPKIVTTSIEYLSRLASGTFGEVSSTISASQQVAIIIPFSELLRSSVATTGINFADMSESNPLTSSSIEVSFCSNIASRLNDCTVLNGPITLRYDSAMTKRARNNSKFAPFRQRLLAYTFTVNSDYQGVSSIVVNSINMQRGGTLLDLDEFTDIARNEFDSADIQFTPETQSFPFVQALALGVEGGAFEITRINLLERSTTGIYWDADESADHYFNFDGDEMYVRVRLTKELGTVPSLQDATLALRVSKSDGTLVDVTSDRVSLFTDGSGQQVKSSLLFYFDLASAKNPLLTDYDGVEVPSDAVTIHNSDNFKDGLNVELTGELTNATISPVFGSHVRIDTDKPDCTTARLTTNADGSTAAAPLMLGTRPGASYRQTLYFALDCDQQLSLMDHPDSTSIRPFIPMTVGDYELVFNYSGMTNSTQRVVYSFDLVSGLPGSGTINVGQQDSKVINWHLVDGNREGDLLDQHQFFSDAAGNAMDMVGLPLANGYLVQQALHLPDDTPDPTSGLILDTRPYPETIVYPDVTTDLRDYYKDSNGTVYLSGNPPTNTLSFVVDYSNYVNDATQAATLREPASNDVSGNYLDSAGNSLLSFSPSRIDGARVTYTASVNYGSTVGSTTIDDLDDSLTHYVADGAPFQIFPVTVYDSNGQAIIEPVLSGTPVNTLLGGFPGVTENTLPSIKINNSRPTIQSLRLFDRRDPSMDELQATGNSTVYFGNMYVLVGFDKPMRDSDLEATYPYLKTTNSSGADITVDSADLIYVPQSNTELQNAFAADFLAELKPENIFYKFVYTKRKYTGSNIKLNPGGGADFIREKTSGSLDKVKDIYGNRFLESISAEQSYSVTLDARSDIELLSFDKISDHYKYGDTVTITVKTRKRINTDQVNNSKALSVDLQMYRNEASDRTLVVRQARALSNAITTTAPDAADADGYTTMVFSYTIGGLDDMFNADTTSDFGMQATGVVNVCNVAGQGIDESSCQEFNTYNINSNGAEGISAILALGSVVIQPAALNSVLNQITADSTADFSDSGAFGSMLYNNGGTATIWTTARRLDTGDTMYFRVLVDTLGETIGTQPATAATNNLTGTATDSSLRFSLYNGIEGKRVNRLAGFNSVSGTTLVYAYNVEAGDLVHIADVSSGQLVDYKINSTDNLPRGAGQAVSLQTDRLFANLVNNQISGLSDTIYSNPVWGNMLDASGVELVASLDISSDELRIDTRPRVTSASTQASSVVNVGTTVQFNLVFDKPVVAAGVKLRLTNGVDDITADLVATTPADRRNVPFNFVVPDIPSGDLSVDAILLGDTGYIRYYDSLNGLTKLNADNTLPNGLVHIDNLTLDNAKPQITGVSLVSGTGIYGARATRQNLVFEFTLDKDVSFDTVNEASDLRLKLDLDTFNGNVLPYYLSLVLATTTDADKKKFRLQLNTANVDDSIEDKDNLSSDNRLLLSGGNIVDSANNNAILTLTSAIKALIEGFDVDIDNSPPFVDSVEFDVTTNRAKTAIGALCNNPLSNIACAGKNANVDLSLVFNEQVTFSNTTVGNYRLSMTRDDTTVDVFPKNPMSATDTTFDLTFNTGSVDYTFNTNKDTALLASSFTPLNSQTITDDAGNVFADFGLFNVTGKNAVADLAIDTITPTIESVRFVEGTYIDGQTISLLAEFSEDVTFSGAAPTIQVQFTNESSSTSNKTFTYSGYKTEGGVANRAILQFDFTIDKTADATRYVSARYLSPFTFPTTPTDYYQNPAITTIASGIVNTNVGINPNNDIVITEVRAEKANGSQVPVTGTTFFTSTNNITFKVVYNTNLTLQNEAATEAGKMYISLVADSTSDALKAYFQGITEGGTLVFILELPDNVEDKDGLTLNPTTIQNSSTASNHLLQQGTSISAPLDLAGRFANDIEGGGADNRLESILVDTLPPESLTDVMFVDTTNDGSAMVANLRLIPNGTRNYDIVKYLVYLADTTDDNQDPYLLNLPNNISFPANSSHVYVLPAATSNYFLSEAISIDIRMTGNQICRPIYARVFSVDEVNQVSAQSVLTSTPLNFNTNAPVINSRSASGDTTYDSFASIDAAPALAASTAAKDACDVEYPLVAGITWVDATGDTQTLLADTSIDAIPGDYTTAVNGLTITPLRTYTTTFSTADLKGKTTTTTHNWTGYVKDMPVRYDFSNQSSVSSLNTGIDTVTNLGTGQTVYSEDGTTLLYERVPANFNLVTLSGDSEYLTNVAPEYDANTGSAYFAPSATSRANLYFDNDTQTIHARAKRNKRVDTSVAEGATIYMVIATPGFDEVAPASNVNKYQTVFSMGTSLYHESTYTLPGSSNGLFMGMVNNITKVGELRDINDSRYDDYTINEFGLATRQVIAYTFSANNGGTACRYINDNDQTPVCTSMDVDLNNSVYTGVSIDKLYFGGQPTSSDDSNAGTLGLLGANLGNFRLHEFAYYGEAHTHLDRRAIQQALMAKWQVPVDMASLDSNIDIAIAALDNQKDSSQTNAGGVSCVGGAGSAANITFPGIRISGIPASITSITAPTYHLIAQKIRSGSTIDITSELLLMNLSLPTGDVTIDATNDGSGGFTTYTKNGSALGGNVETAWDGLCHLGGINEYAYALYVSDGTLSSPAGNYTNNPLSEFEAEYAGQLAYKHVQKASYNVLGSTTDLYAYSLRRLWNYTGPAIQAWKSTGDVTDIGFDASGDLDTAALTAFAGTGDARVKIWYDQSRNGGDMVQPTGASSRYPTIVSSGVVLTNVTGNPQMQFDGISDTMTAPLTAPITGQNTAAFVAFSNYRSTGPWTGFLSAYRAGSNDHEKQNIVYIRRRATTSGFQAAANGALAATLTATPLVNQTAADHQITLLYAENEGMFYQNGVVGIDLNPDDPDKDIADILILENLILGSRYTRIFGANQFGKFGVSEVLVYGSNQSDYRATIEDFQSDYWKTLQ